MTQMKILADAAMPAALDTFAPFGFVTLKKGRDIKPEDLKGIDVLMIRSVTKVNLELLDGADSLKFIGTATAGFDHLDTAEITKRGILWSEAPGNNAQSVGDYILSAILVLQERYDLNLQDLSLGIVGFGHTGKAVLRRLGKFFKKVVLRDPPLYRSGCPDVGASLEEILKCSIVTLHVPLNLEGDDRTYHLIGKDELDALYSHQGILINASRGAVVDNTALFKILRRDPCLVAWLDVFEGEPSLKIPELISCLQGATSHIAGYSLDSKFKATYMLAQSLSSALNIPYERPFYCPEPELKRIDLNIKTLDFDLIRRLVFSVYDVRRDCDLFKRRFKDGPSFDLMRQNYRERRELATLQISGVKSAEQRELLEALTFTVV